MSPPLSAGPAFKTLSRWKLRKGNTKGDSVEILYLCVSLSVFLSQFKLLWDRDSQTDSGAKGGDHTEGTPPAGAVCSRMGASLQAGAGTITPEGLEAQLDEDGDLDVVRRPRAASASEPLGPPRDKVHPTILTQEEDDVLGDEAPESSPYNVIKIGKGPLTCRQGSATVGQGTQPPERRSVQPSQGGLGQRDPSADTGAHREARQKVV